MAEVLVNAKVVNKAGEVGTIVAFENDVIHVDYGNRTTKLLNDAFEKGFLRYADTGLQGEIDAAVAQAKHEQEQEEAAKRHATEKAERDRQYVQRYTPFRMSVTSAEIWLDAAPVTFNNVRKKDQEIIREIFAECDKETEQLHDCFRPQMSRNAYLPKYRVGYLGKYKDVYVFRVLSRNDQCSYGHAWQNGATIRDSFTTETLRLLHVNGRDYCFTKNVSFSTGYFTNSRSFNNWHVSDVKSDFLLNEVIRMCDCGYLNDAVEVKNKEYFAYTKLMMPALYNGKMEVVFKHKAFGSAKRIENLIEYLEGFSSKHIDYAAKYDALNALPIIKKYGLLDGPVLQGIEAVMRKRKSGHSIYDVLKDTLARLDLDLDCADLEKRLVTFVKKVTPLNPGVYLDYIRELEEGAHVTIQDFFDKDYIGRHEILVRQRNVHVSEEMQQQYIQVAEELSWIDREENGRYVMIPKTIAEFMYEGDIQHNCVYVCKYYKHVINRWSVIVFLREEKHAPFVTIEYEYGSFEVLQALGKYNQEISPELYRYVEELGERLRCEMMSRQ